MDERREAMKIRRVGKRLLMAAMLLALGALLGGCVSQVSERPAQSLEDVKFASQLRAPAEDGMSAREEWAILYFLDEEGMELAPVSRKLSLQDGLSCSEAALYALLEGPLEGEDAFWPEIGALGDSRVYELSGGVATVDLPARLRALGPEELFAVRMAITHTLTEFSEVAYVNVLIGGREEGFDLAATMPVGTLSRAEDLDVSARYLRLDEMRQGAQGIGMSRLTTLYFPSRDGRYILPEVRSVAYAEVTPIEYLYTLLKEIGKGTDNPLCMDVPAPMKYIEEMPEIVRTEDGAYRAIEIRLNGLIDAALAEAGLTRGVYLAMLTDTLMGFVPGVEGLVVRIDGEAVTQLAAEDMPDGRGIAFAQTMATRADFAGLVGAPGTLYVPSHTDGKLQRETCVFAQAQQCDARSRLWQLTQRLEELRVLDNTLAQEDILAVYKGETRMLIDLSGAYADALSALAPDAEREVIYAMVNTLTEGEAAQRVAFFFDGEQRGQLAGGLEMRGELWRNPGMVVTN